MGRFDVVINGATTDEAVVESTAAEAITTSESAIGTRGTSTTGSAAAAAAG